MKKTLLTLALVATTSFNLFASDAGGAGPGGGNADSRLKYINYHSEKGQLDYLRTLFSGQIQKDLSKFIKLHLHTNVSNNKTGAYIKSLISEGLVIEAENAKFEFKDKCFEDNNGVIAEKDASTLRSIKGAPICVNLKRLIAYDYKDLAGLAMHEIVRHFLKENENDTITLQTDINSRFELHPIALYTASNFFDEYRNNNIFEDLYMTLHFEERNAIIFLQIPENSNSKFKILTPQGEKINLSGMNGFYPDKSVNEKWVILNTENNTTFDLTSFINREILTRSNISKITFFGAFKNGTFFKDILY